MIRADRPGAKRREAKVLTTNGAVHAAAYLRNSSDLGVPGTEEAGEGTEEEAWEWEEEVPELLEAPSDIMEVRPELSTLPTAGSRIWGNWPAVRAAALEDAIRQSY
jgi:hypothetical protein